MKKTAKILATVAIGITLLCNILLWGTREVDLGSQSEFWDQPNFKWYIGIHFGMFMAFFILNASFKRWVYGATAFFSLLVLALDVFNYRFLHNSFTVLLLLSAIYCIIMYGKKSYRKTYTVLCCLPTLVFILGAIGLLGSSGIYIGEAVVEYAFGICLLIEIWTKDEDRNS